MSGVDQFNDPRIILFVVYGLFVICFICYWTMSRFNLTGYFWIMMGYDLSEENASTSDAER